MAPRDPSDLETLDKVRLVLDYAPAEALESVADDEEEHRLLASLDERIDRDVEATRVQDATVVVERPAVVEVFGVTCDDCGTPFQVEADGPLPRPLDCPSCQAEGTLEPRGEAAAFVLDEDEEAPVVVPDPDLDEEEPGEPEADAFAVPEDEGDRSAVLVPSDADDGAPAMQPAVDPVDALTPDEEPGEEEGGDRGPQDAVEDILASDEGAVESSAEEPDEDEEEDEYTFTPPTADQEDEGDQAVQDLLDEDFGLEEDEPDEDDEERGEAFDDVDWPEEEEDEDEAFSVVQPLDEEPEEAPDPEEELVEPDEDEEDWPDAEPVEDEDDEPEWPELEDEAQDDEPGDAEEAAWPELEDEPQDDAEADEAEEPEETQEADEAEEPEETREDDEAGNPGNSAEAADGDDEIPSEWAGRDLEAEDEPDDGPAAGARGGVPVEQIPGIEDFYADQLAANGYETTADLVADEAWRIGDETGIASALVKKWRRTATLVQELGVGTGYASVLAEAEVGDPDALRGADPNDVASTVNDQLGATDLDLDPVTPEDVAAWTGGA